MAFRLPSSTGAGLRRSRRGVVRISGLRLKAKTVTSAPIAMPSCWLSAGTAVKIRLRVGWVDMSSEVLGISLSSQEAEQTFLAWVLRDPALLRRYKARLAAQDLADVRYRTVWETILELDQEGLEVDAMAILARLEGKPLANKVPGELLASLAGSEALTAQVETCARIISEKALRRRLQVASSRLARLALDSDKDLDEIEVSARAAVREAVENRARLDQLHDPYSRAISAEQRYFSARSTAAARNVPFPWASINELFGPSRPGQYIVVAGASGAGKTAFMHSWAQGAGSMGYKALYFSCEMAEADLTDREVSRWTNIKLTTIRRAIGVGEFGERLAEGVTAVSSGNLYVLDQEPITPSLIESVADEMQATVGLNIVFVDYLQIVSPDHAQRDRRAEVEEISGRLRRLARMLDVPVVVGSQLSRAYVERSDHRPGLEDLRESGKIGNDAWIVIGLYRPGAVRNGEELSGPDNTLEVHAVKNRQDGPTNTFRVLAWDGPLTDIYDPRSPRLFTRLQDPDGSSSAQPEPPEMWYNR